MLNYTRTELIVIGNRYYELSWFGTGFQRVVKRDGIMNPEMYLQKLIHHAIPSEKHLIGNSFIFFYHESDAKHTASVVKAYLDRNTHNPAVTNLPLHSCLI